MNGLWPEEESELTRVFDVASDREPRLVVLYVQLPNGWAGRTGRENIYWDCCLERPVTVAEWEALHADSGVRVHISYLGPPAIRGGSPEALRLIGQWRGPT